MKKLRQDKHGYAWIPLADPREFLIGIAVLIGAILILWFAGWLFIALAGLLLFLGAICVLQMIPPLRGIPGLVVGSVLIALATAIYLIAPH